MMKLIKLSARGAASLIASLGIGTVVLVSRHVLAQAQPPAPVVPAPAQPAPAPLPPQPMSIEEQMRLRRAVEGAVAAPARGPLLPVGDQRRMLQLRLRLLGNISVSYVQRHTIAPPATNPTGAANAPSTVVSQESFHFLNGMAAWDSVVDPTSPVDAGAREGHIWARARAESIFVRPGPNGTQEIRGLIESQQGAKMPAASPIELAMGIRYAGQQGWVTAELVPHMNAEFNGDVMTLTYTDGAVKHVWEVNQPQLAAPMSYTVSQPAEQMRMIVSDLRNISPPASSQRVMMPMSITAVSQELIKGAPSRERERWELTIGGYSLNDPANVPASFIMRWPKGARVTDSIHQKEFVIAADGAELSDAEIQQAIARHPGAARIDVTRVGPNGQLITSAASAP